MTVDHGLEGNSPSGRWRSTIDGLVVGLATHLGEQVTLIDADEIGDAFSCSIRGPEPSGPTFQVAWDGVLGMQYIDGKPDISVSLFLYSRGRRLRLDDQPGSYLEIVYEGPLDGSGTWRDQGWLQDDFGEFEGYDRYGD
ncbi:hypothetical protein ACFYV7_35675 [Nocardia suismassiliense]|uniref:Ig-like domain-containing protein n=1 Tax=Nocardia suismassiliense TaxID=2077092 RepID=A0ABW6R3U0_9NOCA